jgi:hypothetical protein
MSAKVTTPKPIMKGNALATAQAGKIAPSVPLKVSMEACTNIARSTLARVLLNTHVMTIVNHMAVRVNRIMSRTPPPPEEAVHEGTRYSGRCHSAQDNRGENRPVQRLHARQREATPAYFLEQRSSQDQHQSEGSDISLWPSSSRGRGDEALTSPEAAEECTHVTD